MFYGCWVKSGQFGPVCQCKLTNRMTLKVPYTDVIAIEHDVGSPVYRPSCDRTWRWQSRIQTPLRWNTALAVPYTDLLAIEHGVGSPVYRPPCDRTWLWQSRIQTSLRQNMALFEVFYNNKKKRTRVKVSSSKSISRCDQPL